MTGPLNEQLRDRLPWLFEELSFRVTYQDYDAKHMGQSVVELQSAALRVRFVRGMYGIAVEVASLAEPELWFELGFLWYTLTGDRPEPYLDGWAWFFRDHLAELTEALAPNFSRTKQQFERSQEESRQILARHTPRLTAAARIRKYKLTPVGMIVMGSVGWALAFYDDRSGHSHSLRRRCVRWTDRG
jgi:hypothetical protein